MKRGQPKDNHTCKVSLYIYVQLDDYITFLTFLNDIFMLYKVKLKKIERGDTGQAPPISAPGLSYKSANYTV